MGYDSSSSAAAIALVVASGALFAVLYVRDRGVFQAVGAHAAFALSAGAGLRGGFVEVTWSSGLLTSGPPAQGAPAWVAAATCAGLAVAIGMAMRGRSRAW